MKRFIFLLLIVLASGCSSTRAVSSPLLKEGFHLVYTDPPRIYETIDLHNLRKAIARNLVYLEKTDPGRKFNFSGKIITVKDLIETQKTLLQVIETTESQEMLELIMSNVFEWYKATGTDGKGKVLITGYYIPELEGDLRPSEKYRYPLYRPPEDLKPDAPYFSRREIDGDKILEGRGLEIVWLADPVEAFFLHIQGSGIVRLPDGSKIQVHYAANNGHPYVSIGNILIREGAITSREGNLQGIKRYLRNHPERIKEILFKNPRYIFFKISNKEPTGSLQVPLTPGYSIATDPSIFPPGSISFLNVSIPVVDSSGRVTRWIPVKRFVLNQDEGGAIKGPGRVDLFFGVGEEAGLSAGFMKEMGELYFILKR